MKSASIRNFRGKHALYRCQPSILKPVLGIIICSLMLGGVIWGHFYGHEKVPWWGVGIMALVTGMIIYGSIFQLYRRKRSNCRWLLSIMPDGIAINMVSYLHNLPEKFERLLLVDDREIQSVHTYDLKFRHRKREIGEKGWTTMFYRLKYMVIHTHADLERVEQFYKQQYAQLDHWSISDCPVMINRAAGMILIRWNTVFDHIRPNRNKVLKLLKQRVTVKPAQIIKTYWDGHSAKIDFEQMPDMQYLTQHSDKEIKHFLIHGLKMDDKNSHRFLKLLRSKQKLQPRQELILEQSIKDI